MSDDIRLEITASHPDAHAVKLRVSPDEAQRLREALKAQDLEPQDAFGHSAPADLVVIVVDLAPYVAASFAALTAALRTFLHRNDKKRIAVKAHGFEFQAEGLSEKKSQETAERAMDKYLAAQKELDRSWADVLAETQEIDRTIDD